MMKTLLLFGSIAFATLSFGQTNLFTDDFESGTSNWTLNGGSGGNTWVVNNSYTGYSTLIPNTPNQPAGIGGSPQSNYLHIVNGSVCSMLSACNANFDTGSSSNQNAELTTSIDATNYTNVTVSFWYLCAGQTGVSYGNLEYSIDGGTTWTSTGTEYSGTSTWTQETVSLPAWDNASAFKIRFKWQNGSGGSDPAFSIDDLVISGAPSGAITTGTTETTSWCYGEETTFNINFTATGSYNAGNIFTAELSDASGSFASPTSIGNLNSSTAGVQSISGIVSGSTPVGNGYRIRVVSSNPSIIGSDNGSDLTILSLPTVQFDSVPLMCVSHSPYTLSEGTPTGGTYSGTGVTSGIFNPADAGVGTWNITYTYTGANGCSASTSQEITVDGCASIEESIDNAINIYPNPAENEISIIGNIKIKEAELFDAKGSSIKKFNNTPTLNVEEVTPGVYFLHINSEKGKIIKKVAIK